MPHRPLVVIASAMMLCLGCATNPAAYALAPAPHEAAADVPCPLMPRDELFVAELLRLWERALIKDLQLEPRPLPWFLLVSEECEYHVNPRDPIEGARALTTPLMWRSAPVTVLARGHGGEVSLPGGKKIPAGIHSFAGREGDVDYFVLALMELWEKHPAAGKVSNAAEMVLGIAVHELVHTTQLAAMERALEGSVPEDTAVSDSLIESTFKENAEYVAAYRQEADALWLAALAHDDASRRQHAREALGLAKARRARWFQNEHAHLALVEGVMLNLEGTGEWTRLKMLQAAEEQPVNARLERVEPRFESFRALRGMDDAAVAAMVRKQTSREWSQESGLALLIVLEQLSPAWREKVFADPPADPFVVLEEALGSDET